MAKDNSTTTGAGERPNPYPVIGGVPAGDEPETLTSVICEIDDAVMIGIGAARDALKEYLDAREDASPTLELVRDSLLKHTNKLDDLCEKARELLEAGPAVERVAQATGAEQAVSEKTTASDDAVIAVLSDENLRSIIRCWSKLSPSARSAAAAFATYSSDPPAPEQQSGAAGHETINSIVDKINDRHVPPFIASAIGEQQKKIWQAQATIDCLAEALNVRFGGPDNWPANVPQYSMLLEGASSLISDATGNLFHTTLEQRATELSEASDDV